MHHYGGMIDLTVNLGHIITILTVLGGIWTAFVTMKASVRGLSERMGGAEAELKKMSDVLITVARQDERMVAMDQRMLAQGQRLDEMRAAISRMEGGRFDVLCDQVNRLIAAQGAG